MKLVIVAVLGFLAVAMPQAAATNSGSTTCTSGAGIPTNCISFANNSTHALKYVNLGGATCCSNDAIPYMTDAVNWAVTSVYNPTDLTAYRNDGDPYPDVIVYDWYAAQFPDILAWVSCPTNNTGTGGTHPNRWCRGQNLEFNSYKYHNDYGYFDTTTQRRHVACHELGHTVGLRHSAETSSSCMPQSNPDGPTVISSHDINHINTRY
ncbi:MAG: matrixin family metalloprotease [Kineosporiaceae bacterium]|nr:matrixin family metalloprotease [Kineosporiaceae bacterium]